MKKIKSWIKTYLLPYRYLHVSENKWEEQYKRGHWEYLKLSEELPRFSIIAGTLFFYFGEGSSILDLGCGENVLQKMLLPHKYKLYVGVDISQTAVSKALESESENTKFICEDILKYEPDSKFDMIIFNESLYYIKKPCDLLKRYSNFLSENGIILISMWNNKERNNKIWGMIKTDFTTIDEIRLTVNTSSSRMIQILKPI